MYGKVFVTIITDQDATMRLAITNKMLDTFHMLCKWHITHKMGNKDGGVYHDYEAMNEFHEILNNFENVTMFEESW